MLHTRRRIKRLIERAHALAKQEKYDKAYAYITEILNLDMDNPEGLFMAAVYHRLQGNIGLAAQLARRVCALNPKPINPWMHFASCLHDMHHYDAALQIWTMLERTHPKDPQILRNMAGTFLQQGKFHDALNTINKAIDLVDDVPKAYKAIKGLTCLALERWEEGFENYKGLYGEQILIKHYKRRDGTLVPEWDGSKGKVVVVQCEQGIGDEIRFSSVIPDMQKNCEIILDCHPKLVSLFERSFPGVKVFGTRKQKIVDWIDEHDFDATHHLSTLGEFYRKRTEDFPRQDYLVPDETLRAKWREKLKDLPRPLVGIAWQGGNAATQREDRSFDLATFIPIIQEGGSFIDLSYHDSSIEVERFNEKSENKVIRFDVNQENYDDTVALIAELDLIISVPTTIIHAAGAIGKQCFVFNPSYPFWEFGNNRDDMIWYKPGIVKIFRGQIEDLRDAYLHWCGQPATASLHGFAKLDHPQGQQAGTDHTIDPAATPNQKAGTYRVYF